ncbi:MerR family transcriptional regulator [Paenibacillus cellulositrophicus]|uniref:MerR family transcriptional regulator n=1 Tax=Paenibacillus cellulositrophicus TaxID=562959 RepID=UPI003D97D5ED
MSDEQWLKVSDLAGQLEIPQPTIRRYMDRHGHHLHTKKQHKSYLISSASIPTLARIRDEYSKGMNGEQVEEVLLGQSSTITTVSDTSVHKDERVSDNLAEALSELEKSVIDRFNNQEQFNQHLLELLQREQEKVERLTELLMKQTEAAASLSPAVQTQSRKQADHLTERRVKRQLESEALELWLNKPAPERTKRNVLFQRKEDSEAKEKFVRDYVLEHYVSRLNEEFNKS